MRILFVCTGNICRSAFAERYAAAHARTLTVASAGTGAVVGAPVDPAMAAQVLRHGGDPERFAARQLNARMIADADLILTMQTHHRTWILDDDPGAVRRTFVLGQVARRVASLRPGDDVLTHLAQNRRRASGGDEVRDPYRRGEVAMQQAAEQIAAHLDDLLDLLAARG